MNMLTRGSDINQSTAERFALRRRRKYSTLRVWKDGVLIAWGGDEESTKRIAELIGGTVEDRRRKPKVDP